MKTLAQRLEELIHHLDAAITIMLQDSDNDDGAARSLRHDATYLRDRMKERLRRERRVAA